MNVKVKNKQYFTSNWIALIIIIGISVFFPLTAYYIKLADREIDAASINIPIEKNGWQLINENSNLLNSRFPGADKIYQSLYIKKQISINHYIASYYNQMQGKELISELNSIYAQKAWKQINYTKYSIEFSPRCEIKFNELKVASENGQSRLVWYQYNVAGINAHNIYIAKLLAVWDLLYKKQGSHVVILSVDLVYDDLQSARDSLSQYVTEMQIARDLCGLQIP